MAAAMRILGAYHLTLGAFMVLGPGTFYDLVGAFPPENRHYVRDVATAYLAFGVGAWLAARRPAWRTPVLLLILVEYALHVVNHVVDARRAETTAIGVFDVVSLALIAAAVAALLARARRQEAR